MKKFVFVVMIMVIILSSKLGFSLEITPTGFYYPLGTSDFSCETGKWLNPCDECLRPGITGSYLFDDKFHAAVDMLSVFSDNNVYAISDGEVMDPSESGWNSPNCSGNIAVKIRHKLVDDGTSENNGRYFYALYGHIDDTTDPEPGTLVKAGDKIGELGYYANGIHLHFTIRDDDSDFGSYVGTPSMNDWPTNLRADQLDSHQHLNNLVDPMKFMAQHIPDNYISRQEINPNNPITVENPWFPEYCWNSTDSRCDGADIVSVIECVSEESTLCYPPEEQYSVIDPNENGGGGGGSQELPDLETELTVENSAGNIITTVQPGDQIRIVSRPEVKHADAENGNTQNKETVETDFYIDGVFFQREYTQIENLQEGSDHEEEVVYTIPTELPDGTVITFRNIIDAEEEIEETNENDNEGMYQITVRRLTRIEQEIEKHQLTQITLNPGQIVYIEIADNKEGWKIIDGVTYLNDVYKAPQPGMPYTGTLFKSHDRDNNLYALECLGTATGNKWLAGDPDTLDTFLAEYSNEDHHETYWAVYQDPQGRYLLRNMKQGTNPALDGFVWFDGRTEANNPFLVENLDYTGTRLNIIPLEIHWSYAGAYGPPNNHCELWNEIMDPHTWGDNNLCSNVELNFSWSYSGPLFNKRCERILETDDPATWNDNYFCVEHHNPIHFYWSSNNPIPGIKNCIKIEEPAERIWTTTWDNNWLCWEGY